MYYRLKIDGASVDRCVKGVNLLPDRWDNENRIVKTDERQHKAFNKKITRLKTDLERHFELLQAKGEIATPTLVLKAYQTPVRADKRKEEKVSNLAISQTIEQLIGRYLKFNHKLVKAYKHNRVPYPAEEALLAHGLFEMKAAFEAAVKRANVIFDDKEWEKKVMLAVDEHLQQFMHLAFAGERSPNTLEKMWGRKKRFVEFLRFRYNSAYAELDSVAPTDLRVGVDGKQWISKDRQKTGSDETLPLLPIALEIIERYKNHPTCLRRGTLLPVPSCEEYNRCLKEIGSELGLKIQLTTHKARYFFANVVADDNGVELRITGQLMGQKSLKTTAKYVRKNKRLLAENMQAVEDKLFHPDGTLRGKKLPPKYQGKVITLRVV